MPIDNLPEGTLVLQGEGLSIDDMVSAAAGERQVALSDQAWRRVRQGREIVEKIVERGDPAYGISTGVGSQKDFVVPREKMAEFNRRLLAAHATRVPGPMVEPVEVRAAMIIQANMFATGACGVRPDLVSLLLKRLNANQIPTVDASGSVGASDLVPLAQLALGLLGDSFALSAKEALSLMNSNAISLARGALQLHALKRLLAAFDLSSAVALEGLRGNLVSLDEAVARAHRQQGQSAVANRLRALLSGSALWKAGAARFLQDPLSFRCISQIHGAGHWALEWGWELWQAELNAVTDNPLIDLDSEKALSHGNMDTTAVTLAADTLRQILAKIAILSGERMHKQHWSVFSGLPAGLTFDRDQALGGVQFLNFSHIAASLIASLKIWSHPHLTHSIGQLNDGVEDTAGLALHSVTDLKQAIEGGWKIASLEMMIGTWAVKRRDLALSDLGAGVRPVVETLAPLLPMGAEGLNGPFDISPVIELFKSGGLLESAYRASGLPAPDKASAGICQAR